MATFSELCQNTTSRRCCLFKKWLTQNCFLQLFFNVLQLYRNYARTKKKTQNFWLFQYKWIHNCVLQLLLMVDNFFWIMSETKTGLLVILKIVNAKLVFTTCVKVLQPFPELCQTNKSQNFWFLLEIVYTQLCFTTFINVWQLFRNAAETKKTNLLVILKTGHATLFCKTVINVWVSFRNYVKTKITKLSLVLKNKC